MAEENQLKQAKETYNTLLKMLDERKWHYEKDDEGLEISCGVQGDDLPIEIGIRIDPEKHLVILLSPMPFSVPEKARDNMALAVSIANYGLVDGNFDYDFRSGRIIFRQTTSYRSSLLGKEAFTYMLIVACNTIDEYNEKLLFAAKSDLDLEKMKELLG